MVWIYHLIGKIPQSSDPMPPDKHTGPCRDILEVPKGRHTKKISLEQLIRNFPATRTKPIN